MGRRFLRYIDRHFHLREEMAALSDSRAEPLIPMPAIYLTVFLMFTARFRSLNALESRFRDRQKCWPRLIAKHLPSADRVGEVMDENVRADELRRMHERLIKRAQRMKGLHRARGFRYRVGSVDGHEHFATRHRCCPACLRRWLVVDGQAVLEYYHRVVMFQLVGVEPSVVVDLEPVRPGEDEVGAAFRLLARVLKRYPQICDVVVADAAYQEAPFFRDLRARGKHVIAVLKDKRRDLYTDALGMLPNRAPVKVFTDEERHQRGRLVRRVVIRLWDFPEMETWPQLGAKARAVYCEVETTQRTKRGTEWVMETTLHHWWWATDLTVAQASAEEIMRIGRRRWVQENSFNELVCHWAMDHRFKHGANATVTFLLTLFTAHLLEHLFYAHALQPEARANLTCLGLGEMLRCDFGEGKLDPDWRPP